MSTIESTTEATGEPTSTNDQLQRLDPYDLPDQYLIADNVGISPKSETQSWEERPKTRADSCHPEPLDGATEDIYALHEPIALDAEDVGGDSRYLEDGEPLTAFEAVGSYIRRRHGQNTSAKAEGYTTKQQEQLDLYGVGKEMDRQLVRKYDNPTVVLLSLRVSPSPVRRRVTLLEAISDAWDETRGALRYRLQEAPGAPLTASQWEYFAVFAGTAERGTPHLHFVVYCEGDVPRSCFEPVVEKFVEKCHDAPDDGRGNDPSEDTISIRVNGDDTIPRMDDAPEESAGATYVLKQLPHLSDVDDMARDELLHASSVDAWGGRSFRKSEYDVGDGEEDSGVITTLSETERDFVDWYCFNGGSSDPEAIIETIEANPSLFWRR